MQLSEFSEAPYKLENLPDWSKNDFPEFSQVVSAEQATSASAVAYYLLSQFCQAVMDGRAIAGIQDFSYP